MYRELIIKKGREKSLRNRHPWVFSGSAAFIPAYANGEIVEVVTQSGEILGYGFFSPGSQILCRMFEFTRSKVENFTDEYFYEKIKRANDLRKRILPGNTDCYRLINAEGDFFPGVIIDIYGNTAVLQILVKGTELLLDVIADSLAGLGFKNICIKSPGANEIEKIDIPFSFIRGSSESSVVVKENGLQFIVDPEHGQKTGFFIDQRDNRQLVRNFSRGRKVLNAFCYTGGFSLYAMSGGASLVHSVDISAEAVGMTLENIKINSAGKDNPREETFHSVDHKAFRADCFEYLRTMEDGFYDLIILDPPAFVKSSKGVERGARGYKEINLSALKRIRKDSLLFTFSCSHHVDAGLFRKIVFSAAADSGRNVRVLAQLSQSKDHPFSICHPEGEYLKGLMLHVD